MLFVCPNGQIDAIWYQGKGGPNVQRADLEFGFIYRHTGVYCQEGYRLEGRALHVGEMSVAAEGTNSDQENLSGRSQGCHTHGR